MAYTKCYGAVLFLGFSIFVSAMSAMDHRQMFANVWVEHGQTNVARECFQNCCADNPRILNVTKHLIGHKHVMAMSEVGGTIPATWLLAAPEGETLSLFKFLRELCTVRDMFNRLRSAVEGQLNNQKLLTFLRTKKNLLQQLIKIFTDGQGCPITEEQSNQVLTIITPIENLLARQEQLVGAKKFAESFARQLENNPASIKDLAARVQTEIEKYESAGINVGALEVLKVENLNADDLSPLIELVQEVKRTPLDLINWGGEGLPPKLHVLSIHFFSPHYPHK